MWKIEIKVEKQVGREANRVFKKVSIYAVLRVPQAPIVMWKKRGDIGGYRKISIKGGQLWDLIRKFYYYLILVFNLRKSLQDLKLNVSEPLNMKEIDELLRNHNL